MVACFPVALLQTHALFFSFLVSLGSPTLQVYYIGMLLPISEHILLSCSPAVSFCWPDMVIQFQMTCENIGQTDPSLTKEISIQSVCAGVRINSSHAWRLPTQVPLNPPPTQTSSNRFCLALNERRKAHTRPSAGLIGSLIKRAAMSVQKERRD